MRLGADFEAFLPEKSADECSIQGLIRAKAYHHPLVCRVDLDRGRVQRDAGCGLMKESERWLSRDDEPDRYPPSAGAFNQALGSVDWIEHAHYPGEAFAGVRMHPTKFLR